MKAPRLTRALAVLSATVVLAGCASTTRINTILAEPHRYANDPVTVKGEVVHSASLLGRGAYRIDDGTGTLWVVSDKAVPRKGAHVKVKGTIRDAFDLGSIVKLPDVAASGLS